MVYFIKNFVINGLH